MEKKSRLKTALGEATAELQLLRKEAASSRAQWQEKSDIITQLEQEVEELRRGFRRREEELLAGKEEAVAAFSKVEARLEECETAFQRQLRDRDYLHNQALQRIADLEAEVCLAPIHQEVSSVLSISSTHHRCSTISPSLSRLVSASAATKKRLVWKCMVTMGLMLT